MKLFRFLFVLLACLGVASCNKQGVEIPVQEIQLNTTNTLESITFIDDSTGYAAGGSLYTLGELFKTTDGGKTWSQGDSILPKKVFCAFAFSANELLLGAYDGFVARTYDGGANWGNFNLSAYKQVRQISYRNANHAVIVGGTSVNEGMVYSTKDNGNVWKQFLPANAMRAVAFSSDSLVYAAGYGVVYVSNDGGDSWKVLEGIRDDLFCGLQFVTPEVGYMVGWQGGVYKTADNGRHWEVQQKPNQPYSKRRHLLAINFYDLNNGVVVGEDGLLMFTTDGGTNWQKARQLTEVTLNSVKLLGERTGICCGEGGKVFKFSF